MDTNRMIRIIAGSFVLISLALGVQGSPLFVSAYFLWFTAFVGANLLQSGFTRFCLMEIILRKLGVPAQRLARRSAFALLAVWGAEVSRRRTVGKLSIVEAVASRFVAAATDSRRTSPRITSAGPPVVSTARCGSCSSVQNRRCAAGSEALSTIAAG